MCIYSKHKTLYEFHSGEKKMVSVDGMKWYILHKYMQLHSQQPKFKDLKICLSEHFRKQTASSIICKPISATPKCRKRDVSERATWNREETLPQRNILFYHKAANNLFYITCNIGFERNTWAVLRERDVLKGIWKLWNQYFQYRVFQNSAQLLIQLQ